MMVRLLGLECQALRCVPHGAAGIDRLNVTDADEARWTCRARHPGAIMAAFEKTQFSPEKVNQVFIDWLHSVA